MAITTAELAVRPPSHLQAWGLHNHMPAVEVGGRIQRLDATRCCFVHPKCSNRAAPALLVQELRAKGLSAEDIDHGLRSVFGDAMRVEVVPADEADDEGVTVDTRFGKLTRPAAVEAQQLSQQEGAAALTADGSCLPPACQDTALHLASSSVARGLRV